MAVSLAATIEDEFAIETRLIEGDDGIYEVSVGDRVIYTNSGACSAGFPDDGYIIEGVSRATGLTPREGHRGTGNTLEHGPACSLPGESERADMNQPSSSCSPGEPIDACGCGCESGSTDSAAPGADRGDSGSACCGPAVTGSKGGSLVKKIIAGAIILAAVGAAMTSVARKSGWIGPPPGGADAAPGAGSPSAGASCSTPAVRSAAQIELLGGREAVFVLLPGDRDVVTEELRNKILEAVTKLKARGKRTDLVVINQASPAYVELTDLNSTTSLPSVVVIGMGCAAEILSGELTEERVFGAFVRASSAAGSASCGTSSCGSESSSSAVATKGGCCP